MRLLTAFALFFFLQLLSGPPPQSRLSRLPEKRHSESRFPEFTFTRLEYPSSRGRETWTVDYPKADEQFIIGLRGWAGSRLAIADDPSSVALHDPRLFNFPFIYVVEPGYMELSAEDAARLREYLLRGGFLMLDDFWGEYEWANVREQMNRVFPEYEIRELPLDHPLYHCYFDIDEVVQVPNYHNVAYRGRTDEKGGRIPSYHQIVNEDGRVLVFIARNGDNGDAWEWIEQPNYPLKYGLAAYRLGMNLIIYSMTH